MRRAAAVSYEPVTLAMYHQLWGAPDSIQLNSLEKDNIHA